jgi:hypothetical protein
MNFVKAFYGISIAALSISIYPNAAQAQLSSVHIKRGYEGTPGFVSCLPQGAPTGERITDCREVVSKATLEGISGDLTTYYSAEGIRIDHFYAEDQASGCSIYRREEGCETSIRLNSGIFRKGTVKVDPDIGPLTVISYYLDGIRILSIVEDRS